MHVIDTPMSLRGQAVLVTGSREWTDEGFIYRRMALYRRGTVLFHGAARGADTIAANIGRALGFQVIGHSYFSDLGQSGGHYRNKLLVTVLCTYRDFEFSVAVEGFPLPGGSGTQNCLRQAREALLPTYELGVLS